MISEKLEKSEENIVREEKGLSENMVYDSISPFRPNLEACRVQSHGSINFLDVTVTLEKFLSSLSPPIPAYKPTSTMPTAAELRAKLALERVEQARREEEARERREEMERAVAEAEAEEARQEGLRRQAEEKRRAEKAARKAEKKRRKEEEEEKRNKMAVASGSKRKRGDDDGDAEESEDDDQACWNCKEKGIECERSG